MSPSPKVPRSPAAGLRWGSSDLTVRRPTLWRIHRTHGPQPSGWDSFRTYGPIDGMRWDPHPEPQGEYPQHGVLYAACDLPTALAEVFQEQRRIDTVTGRPYATSWTPTRDLTLLDLTAGWPLRAGAAHALLSAPRSTCRAWARAITEHPDTTGQAIDGLWVQSTLTGTAMPVLAPPAATTFPIRPAFSRSLDDAVVLTAISIASTQIGYHLA